MTVLFDQEYNDRVRAKQIEARGVARGKFSSKTESIQDLMSTLQCDMTQAMDLLKIPPEDRPKYVKRLSKNMSRKKK